MNGRYAEEGEFPYTALILIQGAQCTGVVLNQMWIISAAHCFKGKDARNVIIYPGITHYRETSRGFYRAEEIIRYEGYDSEIFPESSYDLALVKLRTKIDFKNNKVNSVCLPVRDYIAYSSTNHHKSLAILTGWGFLNEEERNEKRLKMTQIIIEVYERNPHVISAKNHIQYGKPCLGDSGGPLVQYVNNRAVLVGTLIEAGPAADHENCAKNMKFMSFTYIPYYIDWIINKTLNN